MKSFTRMRGRVFWLVCALCVLLPGIAAASWSSATDFSGTRQAGVIASQAGLKTRLYAESHRPSSHTRRSSSTAIDRGHHIPNNLTATGRGYVDSADADSESGERATTCALLAALRISQRAPRLEDFGPPVERGTRASRRLALAPRFAPRPPPAPLQL
jgi:hypothetical protein